MLLFSILRTIFFYLIFNTQSQLHFFVALKSEKKNFKKVKLVHLEKDNLCYLHVFPSIISLISHLSLSYVFISHIFWGHVCQGHQKLLDS